MTVESFLQEKGIEFEKHLHAATYTSQGLAKAEHVSGYLVAKPVIVKGAQGFTMCVLPAPKHVDLQNVAKVLGDSQVRLATEAEIADLFPDCELGAEAPIGAMFGLKTVMDAQLREDPFLIMQAGTHTESIRVNREDWEKVCEPVVANIAVS